MNPGHYSKDDLEAIRDKASAAFVLNRDDGLLFVCTMGGIPALVTALWIPDKGQPRWLRPSQWGAS